MMGLRRVAVAATGAALLFVGVGVGAGPVEAKRPARVTVCHVSDEGVKAIRVAERAVPALLARGSALPGDSAGEGFNYGDDCSLVPVAICYDGISIPSPNVNFPDLKYFGPIDTLGNAETYSSIDGSCSGGLSSFNLTIVSGTSTSEAIAKCQDLGAPFTLMLSLDVYYPTPGYYLC